MVLGLDLICWVQLSGLLGLGNLLVARVAVSQVVGLIGWVLLLVLVSL
jgi:hypothetical protein